MTETEWWDDLMYGIYGPRQGGARIIVDAQDAKTGVGKTGLAVFIARTLAERYFGYEIEDDDLTLSGKKYLDRWREHPGADQPSVLILDELGGAGAGHARRSMAQQNVDLGNAWQLMRKKRIVTIVTLPHWSKADKDMRQQADYRLQCLSDPIGCFRPYAVGADFSRGDVRTRGYDDVSRIFFPDMSTGCEVYDMLTSQKDELLDSEFFDADELLADGKANEPDADEVRRGTKIKIAQNMRDNGKTIAEISDQVDMSEGWVSNNTNNPSKPAD